MRENIKEKCGCKEINERARVGTYPEGDESEKRKINKIDIFLKVHSLNFFLKYLESIPLILS